VSSTYLTGVPTGLSMTHQLRHQTLANRNFSYADEKPSDASARVALVKKYKCNNNVENVKSLHGQ